MCSKGMRGDVGKASFIFRLGETPALALNFRDPAHVQREAFDDGIRWGDVFADGLDVDGSRLREFGQCATKGNACIGMCAHATVGHRIADDVLIGHGREDSGHTER